MFPAKAHGPTVFDFNSVGVDSACFHQAKEGMPLFMGTPLVTPPMNAIALGNAIKHTPANGKLLLKLAQQDGQFKIIIRDTGRGISQQELPFIFDRLYRAENSSQHSKNSSGLGLAIVKKILDLHNSKIKVISKLEQGTQFSFQLPVAA